jgi:DtxR family transcriptional regulator, Mn-dependent transcriptional regulator
MSALAHEHRPADGVTRSVEDYLKAIYQLASAGRTVGTSEIAQRLELSAPSVSAMVKRLSEQRLVEHAPYKGVMLTEEGRRIALCMVRRHRLIEAYLVGRLGYTWDTVHEEAERLEHAVSDALVARMAAALGNPGFDPHGDPIPTAEGTLPEQRCVPLADVAVGDTVRIARVDEREPERLRYIASFGLQPGAEVTVLDHQPFRGPITVRTGGEQHVIGDDLGRILQCEQAVAAGAEVAP